MPVMTSNAASGAAVIGAASPFFPPALGPSSAGGLGSASGTSTATPASTSVKDRVAAIAGLTSGHLATASQPEVEHVLDSLLGALKNLSPEELSLSDKHSDGSLQITSHLAVWMISKVTDAYGHKLVRLSNVSDRERLRSTAGLSKLLTAAIAAKQGAVVVS